MTFFYLSQLNKKKLMLVSFIFTSISLSLSASSIRKLTSKKKAKEVKAKVEGVSNSSKSGNKINFGSGLKKHSFGIGIGQTFVKGDFQDNAEDKITWDLLYNYSASYSFDMMANFHHSKHKFNNRYVQLTGLAIGIKAKLYQFDSFSPYAVGGLGFYSPKVRRLLGTDFVNSKSKIVFGSNLGVGGDLKLNQNYSIGLLGHYHNPFDVKQEIGSEVEGSYFKLLITALYTF